jgi:DNA repair photolyase
MSRRGTHLDTGNRFSSESRERFDDGWESFTEDVDPGVELIDDVSRTIFATNTSPDIPFTHSINPYRGCEHGCIYCYARPTHEYLGFNAGLDFETKIMVKRNAATLAREEMMKKSWKPTAVSISGVTDAYQPIERKLGITRSVLETMHEFRNPVGIITKNALVLRDLDILVEMAKYNGAAVFLSITTLDRDLARRLEPRTSSPELRLHAIRTLADAGIPVGVSMSPLIPGLTDSEIPALLAAAYEAGARSAFHVMLRLPLAVRPIFIEWLEREEPGRAAKVLNTIAHMRDGRLNLAEFGKRMGGTGARAEAIGNLFDITARRLGYNEEYRPLSTEHFRRPSRDGQMGLFEGE